jgi:RNA polymerase sigma-70 factor, ECF subfamily
MEDKMIDFADIYNGNKQLVWKVLSRFTCDTSDREDLFQEVFLKIYRALPRFRNESKMETWVYKITINAAINFVSKKKRQEKIKRVLSVFRAIEYKTENAEIDIYRPMEKLNARQRSILVLADIEEKTLEEISALLKLPLGTVKSNLHRARETVKKEVLRDEKL